MYWSVLIGWEIFCLILDYVNDVKMDETCCVEMWCYTTSDEMTWVVFNLYFIYMICISMLSCFSLLVRNVITHSLRVVYVWILWWSRTFCSWENMVRWIAMENLMLEYAGTQCFGRMWHCDMSFYIICITDRKSVV